MIRQLNATDAPQYRNIRLEALRLEPHAFLSTFQSENEKPELFMERCLKTGNKLNLVFGAFAGEVLIGIAGFVKEQAEIIQLYVDKKYRGSGLGRKLLTTALNEAFGRFPDLDIIDISVLLTPNNAAKLYQSLGFEAYRLDETAVVKDGSSYDLLYLHISGAVWQSSGVKN